MIQVINGRTHKFTVQPNGKTVIAISGVLSTFESPSLVDAVLTARMFHLS